MYPTDRYPNPTEKNPLPNAMFLLPRIAARLNEQTDERDVDVLSEILSQLRGADAVFEHAMHAFDTAGEITSEEEESLWIVLRTRILIQPALDRLQNEHLDWFADLVDETLEPFKRALLMLEIDGAGLRNRFEGEFLDYDRWWGWLADPAHDEAARLVERVLDHMSREYAIARLVAEANVSKEKGDWCLTLAEEHLRNLFQKYSDRARVAGGCPRFEELCMQDHEDWKEMTAFWNPYGHPLRHQISRVAAKLVKTSDEKLKLFEKRQEDGYA